MAALVAAAIAVPALLVGGTQRVAAQGGGATLEQIGEFSEPVHVENAPGARKLLFVVEQSGVVRVLRKGRELDRPFLDLSDQILYGGEQGLLSIAFDPGYAKNRRFYVYYVDRGGNIRVDSLKRKRGSKVRAAPRSRRALITVEHPENENHNGGQLQFGPDRLLYIGTGDGGGAGDPSGNAQDPDSLLGKMLRIEPKRKRGYRSPRSNPFAAGAGRDEIYATGLRNPFRFSFDRQTGDLLIGDVGQDEWEEINRVAPELAGGSNFGWDLFEGEETFEGDGSEPANYRPPILQYPSGGGNCAVTGGYVSRDPANPAFAGRYLYADFCAGEIRSLDPAAPDPAATDAPTGLELSAPSSFGEGARGRLYVASLSGPVYRIVAR